MDISVFIDKMANEYAQLWRMKIALECSADEANKEIAKLKDELAKLKAEQQANNEAKVSIPQSFEAIEEHK